MRNNIQHSSRNLDTCASVDDEEKSVLVERQEVRKGNTLITIAKLHLLSALSSESALTVSGRHATERAF